ncbi:MAG TPA: hypothetical protein ENJ82_07695, partial [Bacteroidetes bacterium]|nr:hypothetical protein [Bacteroidota bacterium]
MKLQFKFLYKFTAVFCLTLAAFAGCMQPLDGDFEGESQGLKDQELLWVLQVPKVNEQNLNAALFRDAIPAIVRDVLNGNLPVYEDFAMQMDLQKVRNIGERLKQFGGNKQDISPLYQVFELISLVDLNQNTGLGKPVFLRLIWHDPAGIQADRNFAGIRISDLQNIDYQIVTNNTTIELTQLFHQGSFYYQPIYLRTNEQEYTIQTKSEANYLKTMIVQGNWENVD